MTSVNALVTLLEDTKTLRYPTSTKLVIQEESLMHRGYVFHPRGHFTIYPI